MSDRQSLLSNRQQAQRTTRGSLLLATTATYLLTERRVQLSRLGQTVTKATAMVKSLGDGKGRNHPATPRKESWSDKEQ